MEVRPSTLLRQIVWLLSKPGRAGLSGLLVNVVGLSPLRVGGAGSFAPSGSGSAPEAYTVPAATFSRPQWASSAGSANVWGPQVFDPFGS